MINEKDKIKKVWEVGGYDTRLKTTTFVVADSINTVKQYFYIGGGGFIRERPDVDSTPEMRVLHRIPTQEEKSFRAELAARAMQGLLSNKPPVKAMDYDGFSPALVASAAVLYADALINELNK